MASNRMIKSLRDYDHVKIRPTMYVGQIAKTDVKVPIFTNENGHVYIKRVDKYISPAFYKLYDEVLGNAFDEAVRLKGKMPLIEIYFNSKTNEVVVKDTGGGFYMGTEINEISNRTNIETAFTQLRAGSNFEDGDDELIGTNGVGVSLVNMLSEKFQVETINNEYVYKQEWLNSHWENNTFSEPQITQRKKEKTGTTVRFIPSHTLFSDNVWDKDYIYTLMLLKNFVKNENPLLKNVTFKAFFDNVELNLKVDFLPKNSFFIESKIGKVWVYPIMPESMDISFINGQLCEGIHEKIIGDYINNIFGFQYAHWYYNTFISLNLHPKLVRFADQNKTKFATGKLEILPEIKKNLFTKLETIKTNKFVWDFVNKKISEYEKLNALKEFKRAKRKSESVQFSSKYYPAAVNKDYIFIAEGLSASGGLTENRDTKNVGVYALKGKIKNVRNITELSTSQEIMHLMTVLGLDLEKRTCAYKNIIIATDADCIDANSIIITKKGDKKIKDVGYDDFILTHEGDYLPIKEIIQTVKEYFLEIRINNHKFICSENHTLIILRNGKTYEIKANELLPSDHILLKR